MAYIGKQPVVGNFQVCDAITVVNGQAAYTMQVSSANVNPENANHMLVSLNGVLQKPGSSFTISGATITFASNLATGDVIDFIILLGNVLDIGTPSDDSVGAAQIKDDLISGTTALTSAPAATDEFLVSDAGTLKRVDASLVGRGKILQVVSSGAINAGITSTATSYTAVTSHSLDITPSATSSKIFILVSFSARSNSTVESHYTLYRDSTNLGAADGFITLHDDNDSSDNENQCTLQFLDSPSSTSALTYALYGKTDNGSNSFRVNVKGNDSVITLMEVAG